MDLSKKTRIGTRGGVLRDYRDVLISGFLVRFEFCSLMKAELLVVLMSSIGMGVRFLIFNCGTGLQSYFGYSHY